MQTPEKIKIGYKGYKLEEWKQTVASANEAQGQFFSKEGVIGYTGDEKGVSHANTLIHELLHAIIYQWNMELEEKVESGCASSGAVRQAGRAVAMAAPPRHHSPAARERALRASAPRELIQLLAQTPLT